MKRLIAFFAVLCPLCAFAARTAVPEIVPMPQKLELTQGSFNFKGVVINCDPAIDKQALRAVRVFADRLTIASGKLSSVASPIGLPKVVQGGKLKGLYFIQDAEVPAEGYKISIGKNAAVVRASDFNGFFYSLQTIKQMLPLAIYGDKLVQGVKWSVPCCEIEDAPRFAYRGYMLDCSRHFFSTDEVKRILDVMAMYKYNIFHWHLTDDQGWRVEIEKYPRLTEVGAFRFGTQIAGDPNTNDGIRYGGFYTKEQIRDIIAYAQARGITIIPEIDLPGHMQAALTAYPELGCAGSAPYEVRTVWGISKQVLNVGKEETMVFLENVLSEIAELFPSEYIHIGGDECPRDEWKADPDCQAKIVELGLTDDSGVSAEARLQNYVTARMQKFLATKGKRIIGWDEILEGELAKGATVMSWRGTAGGIKAASMGYDVIMSPNSYCYLDYIQSEDFDSEPFSISHRWSPKKRKTRHAITLERVYSYEPLDEIPQEAYPRILGVQGNLWTEYIATDDYLEYMTFPRLLALSEVQWCMPENKNYDRFLSCLKQRGLPLLEMLGYNYRQPDELK